MFSLIITIISVALVAALALATLYYGGGAFNDGKAQADAAKIKNQGQQILAAAQLYRVEQGQWPASIPDMVAKNYLKTVPVAQGSVGAALAESSWDMPVPRVPVFTVDVTSVDTCRKVNEKAYGLPGVLPRLHTSYSQQCYGESLSSLTVVTSYNGEQLLAAADAGTAGFGMEDVTSDAIPAADDASAWLVKPDAENVVSPGGGGDTGGGDPDPEEPVDPVDPGFAAVGLSQSQVTFTQVATNTAETQVLTVSNPGTTALTFSSPPALTGHASFTISDTSCGASLPAGQSCDITIRYAPTEVSEAHAASLSVQSNASSSPDSVAVGGSSYNPVSLQTSTLPSGSQGQPYGPFDFDTLLTVSNEQSPDLSLVQWTRTGTLPQGMTFENGVLSGTPTQSATNVPLTVVATYKDNQGQQVYVLNIAGGLYSFSQVSAGTNMTCGVTTSGIGKCWGSHTNYRLGQGVANGTHVTLPADVVGLPGGVTKIAAGDQHACAIAGGSVYCWGQDSYGRVGNGATRTDTGTAQAIGLTGAVDVRASNYHTCALLSDGTVRCWGLNSYGQVGTGNQTNQQSPVSVFGLTGLAAAEVAVTSTSTCALLSDGTVRCWGEAYGLSPVAVSGAEGLVSLKGMAHSSGATARYCGLKSDGTLICWVPGGSPAQISGLSSVTSFGVNQYRGCAALASGGAKCWLWTAGGTGAMANVGPLPAPIADIQVGYNHACVLLTDSSAYCWGDSNGEGKIGDGTTTTRTISSPGKVGGAS